LLVKGATLWSYTQVVQSPVNTQFAVAVHLLTLLALNDTGAASSEALGRSLDANPVHARRILGRLRDAGLVSSRPGPNGGWKLERDPDVLTLDTVWQAIQCDRALLGIHNANDACPVGKGIKPTLALIERAASDAVIERLSQITLREVAEQTMPAPA
jgi:Rrf2 family protein